MDDMSAADAGLATLRGEVIDIIPGTVFYPSGRPPVRWQRSAGTGVCASSYGGESLAGCTASKHWTRRLPFWRLCPTHSKLLMYLLLVSALFAWRELSLGTLRLLIQLQIFAGLAIALIGFGTFVLGGPNDKWIFYNNLLAVFAMLVLLTVVLVPKFSKFLVIPNHRIREAGGVCGRGAPVSLPGLQGRAKARLLGPPRCKANPST